MRKKSFFLVMKCFNLHATNARVEFGIHLGEIINKHRRNYAKQHTSPDGSDP